MSILSTIVSVHNHECIMCTCVRYFFIDITDLDTMYIQHRVLCTMYFVLCMIVSCIMCDVEHTLGH